MPSWAPDWPRPAVVQGSFIEAQVRHFPPPHIGFAVDLTFLGGDRPDASNLRSTPGDLPATVRAIGALGVSS